MKCNITIDYTIAVVPDVNEFNWVLQNQVDVAFLSSSFCKFFDQLFCSREMFGFFWCFLSFLVIRLKFFFFLLFFVASRGRFFHVDVNAVLFFSFFLLIFFSLNAYG
jgi:hypothetical protein